MKITLNNKSIEIIVGVLYYYNNDVSSRNFSLHRDVIEFIITMHPVFNEDELRKKLDEYMYSLPDNVIPKDDKMYIYCCVVGGELVMSRFYEAIRVRVYEANKLREIALDDYVCTIECKSWSHIKESGISIVKYGVDEKGENKYSIIVYKNRLHLQNRDGTYSIVSGIYHLFNECTYNNK